MERDSGYISFRAKIQATIILFYKSENMCGREDKKIVIITSNALRHKFFTNRIAQEFVVPMIFSEEKAFNPLSNLSSSLSKHHFLERDKYENKYFGLHQDFNTGVDLFQVGPAKINDPIVIEKIKAANPDVIAVFGSSILKNFFIHEFDSKMLNMHLGLSPYYRGSGTNFWALVNNEPEYVGTTIHILARKIDAGDILAHARPDIMPDDGPHDIGCKTIICGTEKFIEILRSYEAGKTKGMLQWPVNNAKVYKRSDVTDEDIALLYQNFSQGMIGNYLSDKNKRDEALRLIG